MLSLDNLLHTKRTNTLPETEPVVTSSVDRYTYLSIAGVVV